MLDENDMRQVRAVFGEFWLENLKPEFDKLGERIGRHKDELHGRISATDTARGRELGDLRDALGRHAAASCPGAHPAAQCPDVIRHEERCRIEDARRWTVFGIIVTAIIGGLEILKRLFNGNH